MVPPDSGPCIAPVYMRQPTIPALRRQPTGNNYAAHCMTHWLLLSESSDFPGTRIAGSSRRDSTGTIERPLLHTHEIRLDQDTKAPPSPLVADARGRDLGRFFPVKTIKLRRKIFTSYIPGVYISETHFFAFEKTTKIREI